MHKNRNKPLVNFAISSIFKGLISGITTFTVFLSVFSLIILNTEVSASLLFVFVLISGGISSFFCALVSALSAKKSRLILAQISSLILLVTEFIFLLCFNNASLSVKIYLIAPIALFLGLVGGIMGSNIRLK